MFPENLEREVSLERENNTKKEVKTGGRIRGVTGEQIPYTGLLYSSIICCSLGLNPTLSLGQKMEALLERKIFQSLPNKGFLVSSSEVSCKQLLDGPLP